MNKQIHAIKNIGSEDWVQAVKEREKRLKIELKREEEKANFPNTERKELRS